MQGKIALKGLMFHSFHGVHSFERERGNDFRIDLVFQTDISKAALSDKLADTLDYEEVYQIVAEIMEVPVNLLEHLAYKISEKLFEEYTEVKILDITVAKILPPLEGRCEESSVSLVRHR
ncbi:MAG: dihydroneopterin aldolase [Imperialibacter sp.]|jgi:7,8-dihydroneopterin aldolase/epimerase/oxygenase|uniref:dihydroneopterin aldolase n=1 Tax=unclassified Imperialibacter TaxID=2629706 RepID=UPI001256CE58|nr:MULTISPECIES: dihydroneopterin aldolase [unclassified Imperialibacter]CAD5255263.1 7,8-dihydroneopterin aldolase [Imperialibacter sp. 75]CAD5263828.1 7,8-dihydroneopterin aldolase [Imperialibacter sp. 89]VVT35510.1 7,8-dihydroneopterin aldolase [Imperialibacter sp. EC-SDR9]|tara:strand:+ start:444 stop:803 length:360 start_codon:yes stop_codon:yes gene_type:complete